MVKGEPREVAVSVREGRDGEGRSELLAEEEGMCPGSPRVLLRYSGCTQSWGDPGKGGCKSLRGDQ